MPLFHVFAIAMCLHLSIYCRGRLVIQQKFHPVDALAAIAAERVTILPAAPTVFIGLMAHSQFSQTAFDSLRVCFSGSAPLPAEVLRLWEERTSTRILEGYGQTEAGPVLSYVSERDQPIPGSVGRPLPLTEINIVSLDDGKSVLPLGEHGEIRARGPQIMSGYRNRPEETAAALRDGWLFTGDLGFLDIDGYLHISGRKKEIVIVGGFNVYPREIEEVLHSHPDIEQAAAIGVPDAYRGEVIAAWVVLCTGSSVSLTALQAYCAERLTSYKRPQIITITTQLPRTTVGKIDKSQLLESLAV
jgi:long-chain acyl-CoA synthetase